MENIILLDVQWLVNANLRQRDKDGVITVCTNLLRFSYKNKLLINNPLGGGELLLGTIIKESDLTNKGKFIFEDLVEKWLGYTDNETGQIDRKNNIKMLEKYYNKIIMDLGINDEFI